MTQWECIQCGDTAMSSMRGGRCGPCNILNLPEDERHVCPSCCEWVESARYPDTCFECSFWEGQIGAGNNVVIAGVHYRVDFAQPLKTGDPNHLGMSGRKYHIQMTDGRSVVTNDLWYQGQIPERFRDRLPDNAVMVL